MNARRFPWFAALLVAATAVSCGVLVRVVHHAGLVLPIFRVDAARALPLRFPEWIPEEWVADVRAVIARHAVFSIFNDEEVAGLRDDVAAMPWVKQVRVVRRELPRTLRLALEPRVPVALALYGERRLVLDADGVVLPPGTFADETIRALPRIVGLDPAAAAAPVTGQAWRDPAAADGVSVVCSLARLGYYAQDVRIEAVDVTNAGGRADPRETEILLVTAGGTRIKWGRSPRAARYGELAPDVKFANLGRVARAFPKLEGVSCVNLRFDRPDVFDAAGQWLREIPDSR